MRFGKLSLFRRVELQHDFVIETRVKHDIQPSILDLDFSQPHEYALSACSLCHNCLVKAMFPTLILLTYFSIAVLSATVPKPAQGAYEGGSGSSLSLAPINDSSAEPILSDSSLVIESVGDVLSTNTTFLLPDSNSSNSEYALPFEYPDLGLLGATNADLQCKGGNFGVNLSRLSCNSAFDRLSNSPSVMTWGQRGAGSFQIKLPFRASSSDGFCAIDVVHAPGKVSDLTSPLQVKQAASQVINGCVKNGAPNTGGLMRNIGMMMYKWLSPLKLRFTRYHFDMRFCVL